MTISFASSTLSPGTHPDRVGHPTIVRDAQSPTQALENVTNHSAIEPQQILTNTKIDHDLTANFYLSAPTSFDDDQDYYRKVEESKLCLDAIRKETIQAENPSDPIFTTWANLCGGSPALDRSVTAGDAFNDVVTPGGDLPPTVVDGRHPALSCDDAAQVVFAGDDDEQVDNARLSARGGSKAAKDPSDEAVAGLSVTPEGLQFSLSLAPIRKAENPSDPIFTTWANPCGLLPFLDCSVTADDAFIDDLTLDGDLPRPVVDGRDPALNCDDAAQMVFAGDDDEQVDNARLSARGGSKAAKDSFDEAVIGLSMTPEGLQSSLPLSPIRKILPAVSSSSTEKVQDKPNRGDRKRMLDLTEAGDGLPVISGGPHLTSPISGLPLAPPQDTTPIASSSTTKVDHIPTWWGSEGRAEVTSKAVDNLSAKLGDSHIVPRTSTDASELASSTTPLPLTPSSATKQDEPNRRRRKRMAEPTEESDGLPMMSGGSYLPLQTSFTFMLDLIQPHCAPPIASSLATMLEDERIPHDCKPGGDPTGNMPISKRSATDTEDAPAAKRRRPMSDWHAKLAERMDDNWTCEWRECKPKGCKLLEQHVADVINGKRNEPVQCQWGQCKSEVRGFSLMRHIRSVHLHLGEICPHCKKSIERNLLRHEESCMKRQSRSRELDGSESV